MGDGYPYIDGTAKTSFAPVQPDEADEIGHQHKEQDLVQTQKRVEVQTHRCVMITCGLCRAM